MVQTSIELERQLVWEIELKALQRKKYQIATVVLGFLSAGLLAGVIVLSVVHIRHLQECIPVTNTSSGPIIPEAPPLVAPPSKRHFVIATVPNGQTAPRPTGTTDGRNSTSPEISKNGNGTCEAGSVYGGRQLDDLNHGYMPLMQKALSLSPAAQDGEVLRDFYHTSLNSVFRCVDGELMDVGSLELVAACKGGYVVNGDEVECNEDGSYEGDDSASAPAPSPSDGSGYAGI